MKSIIKTCLVAVALMIGTSAYAQLPVQFGVNAGMNLSNLGGDDADDSDAKIGFQVGFTVEYNITPELFLQSGLSFTTKGAKDETKLSHDEVDAIYYYLEGEHLPSGIEASGKVKETVNAMYLQLPIRIGYRIPVTDAFKVNINAGPYLAYGIGGKIKDEATITLRAAGETVSSTDDEKYDSFDDGRLKRFDFGLGFGVGAEFGKIGVNLGYELGLTNISDAPSGDLKNRNAFLTVGYKF